MTDYVSPAWRGAGACVSADPDLFFPISMSGTGAVQAERACRICAGCRVMRQCLEFAMENGETEGIWGGTTPAERLRAKRAMTASRRGAQPAATRAA